MVRFTVLTCVFGMAAFCLAGIIQSTTSYAQTNECPCWDITDGLYSTDALGDPATIELNSCDTMPNVLPLHNGARLLGAIFYSAGNERAARAFIYMPSNSNGPSTRCELNATYQDSEDNIRVSEAQACLQDILAYCRDYCMYNPNANCP